MKNILLAFVFVLIATISNAQSYCNQSAMVPTKTFTSNGSVLCCTMEKILVCPGGNSVTMNIVADTIYSNMNHRIFLGNYTWLWLKNTNNLDTIFMKNWSTLRILGTLPGTVTVVMEGSASIINVNSNCTVNTLTCTSITSPTVSCPNGSLVNEIVGSSRGIKIYPNPANDRITIELESAFLSEQKIYIMNSLGQIVQEGKLSGNSTELILKDLAAGIYYLSCENSAPIKLSISK